MEIQLYSKNRHHILYDAQQISQISELWFQQKWWQDKAQISEPSGGRGQAIFVRPETEFWPAASAQPQLVIRHYRRGGLIARLIKDHYLFTGLEHSRPWQEFNLTCTLYQQGLPVPRPLAAHLEKKGLFYQADLITERLPDSRPFADYLHTDNHNAETLRLIWQNVGLTLARFHRFGLNHSDLNANNILVTFQNGTQEGSSQNDVQVESQVKVWVIDFDRCQLDDPNTPQWQQNNLQRLQRSILKLTGQTELPALWQQLQTHYLEQIKKQ